MEANLFDPGEQVICIDDSQWEPFNFIKKGNIYTVHSIEYNWGRLKMPACHLYEFPCGQAFYTYRFRPLTKEEIEQTTKVSEDA